MCNEMNSTNLSILKRAVENTWSQIGHDIGDVPNDEAIEACVDADRLEYNGDDEEANKLFRAICNKHSYHAALQWLSNNISIN